MRIARVVTVCVALILTFFGAETVHARRRPQLKDLSKEQPQAQLENGTDPSEITFTTLRPEMTSFNHKLHSHVHSGANRMLLRVRPSRSMPPKLRGLNRFKGNRRRRQLHSATKPTHVGRSYDLNENYVENQQIETVQGPAEAFDEGVVHIEPIYRVTQNRNIFDSILDIFRKLIDSPKAVGPLVGPFKFPGVGDKVYIRLLEPDKPDHLVIRLISHLPASEVDSTFDKYIIPANPEIEHAVRSLIVPSISHVSTSVTNSELTNSYAHGGAHLASSDSLLSSSNSVAQISKTSSASGQKTGYDGHLKGGYSLRTFRSNFKGDPNGMQKVVRHHKRHPPMVAARNNNNHVTSSSHFKLADQVNKGQDSYHLPQHGFQPSLEHDYRYRPPLNESSKGSPEIYNDDWQQFHDNHPTNISIPEQLMYNSPTDFEPFENSPIVSDFQIPISAAPQLQSESHYNRSAESPKYSIKFTSKNMKYLNMDGSVDSNIKENSEKGFKPVELGPIFTKNYSPDDHQWEPIRRTNVATKETTDKPSTDSEDNRNFRKRNDSNRYVVLRVYKKPSSSRRNYIANRVTNRNSTTVERQISRTEEKNSSAKSPANEFDVNNSKSSVKSASNSTSTKSP